MHEKKFCDSSHVQHYTIQSGTTYHCMSSFLTNVNHNDMHDTFIVNNIGGNQYHYHYNTTSRAEPFQTALTNDGRIDNDEARNISETPSVPRLSPSGRPRILYHILSLLRDKCNFSYRKRQTTSATTGNFLYEDVEPADELYKKAHCRVHSARIQERLVVVKVFHGDQASVLLGETLDLNRRFLHPRILRPVGISSPTSGVPFIVFDGACNNSIQNRIASALLDSLHHSAGLGVMIVSGLAIPPSESFCKELEVYITDDDNIKISFGPFDKEQDGGKDGEDERRKILHDTCSKVFKEANYFLYRGKMYLLIVTNLDFLYLRRYKTTQTQVPPRHWKVTLLAIHWSKDFQHHANPESNWHGEITNKDKLQSLLLHRTTSGIWNVSAPEAQLHSGIYALRVFKAFRVYAISEDLLLCTCGLGSQYLKNILSSQVIAFATTRKFFYEDVEPVDELYEKAHYRVHSARIQECLVVVKVFHGSQASVLLGETLDLNRRFLHPHILRPVGISSPTSDVPLFIVFDGACKIIIQNHPVGIPLLASISWVPRYLASKISIQSRIASALSDNLQSSIQLGIGIVSGLAVCTYHRLDFLPGMTVNQAGLDYLFSSRKVPRDFSLLKELEVYITELDREKAGEDERLEIFDDLCSEVFKQISYLLLEHVSIGHDPSGSSLFKGAEDNTSTRIIVDEKDKEEGKEQQNVNTEHIVLSRLGYDSLRLDSN
ncbi:hypothetical protein K435DRAFT_810986 [Dendrothele bispora CBS 962.96]|uniref:Protein kinase domain-containing protein n=1 Tax=Dendrothele bispora (strain CBS 962.96) TaxID=1314807 RepID=A0A4S8KTE4_DENBC|nr:hypothetical protein K435DRAFT_810986 [Dendrothele bispora CBS 962.96]